MWKPTKNPKILELTKSFKDRALQLSRSMKPDVVDGKRMCCWCGEVDLGKNANKKYCSKECSEAIFTWAQPQKGNGLHALLVRQDWKCNICQHDWKPDLENLLEDCKLRKWAVPNFGGETSEFFMKRFKNRVRAAQSPEVDHIVPISKGGESLGLGNHQAICYTCHKTKTKVDNSGPRKKKPLP